MADWRRYATALAEHDRAGSALRVLASIPGSQDSPDSELDLGIIAASSGLEAYAEFVLRGVARRSQNPIHRGKAGDMLRQFLEYRQTRGEDTRLHELQLEYFAEGLGRGRNGAERYGRLARLTIEVGQADKFGSRMSSTLRVLDDGLARHPDSTSLLEAKATCLAAAGQFDGLDELLRRLEELDPGSAVLRQLSGLDESYTPGDITDDRRDLAIFLLEKTSSTAVAEADAATADLRTMVAQTPQSRILRLLLGYALVNTGNQEEALTHARLLASMATPTHERHYDAAQLFRACVDRINARHHAELARQYALTDGDRADAERLLSELADEEVQ